METNQRSNDFKKLQKKLLDYRNINNTFYNKIASS